MLPIETARAIRSDRLAKIRSANLAFPMADGAKVVVHSIPVRRDPYAINIDVGRADRSALVPLGGWSQHPTYDFDGAYSVMPGPRDAARGYAALFRMGMIEAVDTALVPSRSYVEGVPRFIPSASVAGAIIVGTRRFLAVQQAAGVAAPVAIGVSLLGVKGFWLAVDDQRRTLLAHEVTEEDLIFPEVIVRDLAVDVMALLRSTFDQLWNAAGLASCADYDDARQLMIAIATFENQR